MGGWELIWEISDVCVFSTLSSGLRESVKILYSYFRVECRRCASQHPSNIAGLGALEHNQAKLSKFPGLHLQRSFDNVSSSYLLRSFVYVFETLELICIETRGLWGFVWLSGKFGCLKCSRQKFLREVG